MKEDDMEDIKFRHEIVMKFVKIQKINLGIIFCILITQLCILFLLIFK
jgi:hypothetical protein